MRFSSLQVSGRVAALVLAASLVAPVAWAQHDVAPVVLESPAPVYPEDAPAGSGGAHVGLRLLLDAAGVLVDAQVIESAGASFDRAALASVRRWSFRPATRDGQPIQSRIKVMVVFDAPPAASVGGASPAVGGATSAAGAGGAHVDGPRGEGHGAAGEAHGPATDAPATEVTVHASSRVPSRGAGDIELNLGKLRAVPRQDAAAILKLAPGVFLTNEGGAGHPYQIFLRGFDAREGQDVEFLVGGLPINEVGNVHGNGLVDTHFVIPEVVQALRVIEGPFAPQQGNFAVAGTAQYELGLEQRGLAASTTVGSFGSRRGLLLWGPSWGGPKTFGAAEAFKTDGFGQNRAATRSTAMISHEGKLGTGGTWRLLATSYAAHYSSAGVLRVDDMKAGRVDFFGTYDPGQGGDSTRHMVQVALEQSSGGFAWAQVVGLTVRDFRIRENLTGYLNDPQLSSQTDHAQRGDLIDQRSKTLTLQARGSGRKGWSWGGQKQSLELGYSARVDDVDSVQQRNRAGTNIPYRRDLDLASSLSNVALYADAELRPWRKLAVRGGVRNDLFHYRVQNRCALTAPAVSGSDPADTECFTRDRTGYRSPDQTASTSAQAFLPRASLLLGPWAGVTFSLSRGSGVRSLDPQYINQNLDTPFASATSTEGGVAFAGEVRGAELTLRSIFFQTSVDRDLFFNQTEGRNTLSDGTTRTGWSGVARLVGEIFDVSANLTLTRSTFNDTHLLIPYAPSVVGRVDAVLAGELFALGGKGVRGTLGSGASYVGPRPLPFDELSQSIFLVDAAATLRWGPAQLGLTTTNLFDRKFRMSEYNYTSFFRPTGSFATQVAARHFVAGEPRAVYGTFTLWLDDLS